MKVISLSHKDELLAWVEVEEGKVVCCPAEWCGAFSFAYEWEGVIHIGHLKPDYVDILDTGN